ncbi:hypothetical protein BJ878DRAFT_478897 [Calycina marina]|uniref:Uncharacterized protein n=1 Tax=Calycina marina TaxID=1763456 RepID=A0A9P7Z5N0_9HELO|nr:hypothetical protein BJ878DRAFT_478897 [Calycina marina]
MAPHQYLSGLGPQGRNTRDMVDPLDRRNLTREKPQTRRGTRSFSSSFPPISTIPAPKSLVPWNLPTVVSIVKHLWQEREHMWKQRHRDELAAYKEAQRKLSSLRCQKENDECNIRHLCLDSKLVRARLNFRKGTRKQEKESLRCSCKQAVTRPGRKAQNKDADVARAQINLEAKLKKVWMKQVAETKVLLNTIRIQVPQERVGRSEGPPAEAACAAERRPQELVEQVKDIRVRLEDL